MSDYSEQNWSGHVSFSRSAFHEPRSIGELQAIVAGAERVGVIGSRHSFNDIADTVGDLLWLGNLDPELSIDPERMTASFGAGMTYEQLLPELHAAGLALANTASLTHISVVGACTTGTHGSGDGNGNLSTAVAALDLVTAEGDVLSLSRGDDPRFEGAVVSLGGLGVVSRVTLDLVPAFEVVQSLYADLPFETIFAEFDSVTSAGYSVSLFPSFQQPWSETVWVKRRMDEAQPPDPDPGLLGADRLVARAKPARYDRTMTVINDPGPWLERLPHFAFVDAMVEGTELQSEYFVPREHAVEAIRALTEFGPSMSEVLEIAEIRTVAGDELWLSPAHGRDTVALHFNWFKDANGVEAVLPDLEAVLAPFEPRPHWGKLFDLSAAHLDAVFPRMSDFRDLMKELDPGEKFMNEYLRTRVLGADDQTPGPPPDAGQVA